MAEERLQKILSRAGVTSRRRAEEYIVAGRVRVNGQVITELGAKADLDHDHVKVDGKLVRPAKNKVYLMVNKPKAVMTTMDDPEGRPSVTGLLRGIRDRVYPVGRLDYQSEGLLLLTNDGDFANAITSARNHVEKIYVVKVTGTLTEVQEQQFRDGVVIDGRRTAPAGLKLIKPAENPWYEVRLIEGRSNQIRLMFKHFGLLVEKLRRVKIAFLKLDVPPGEFRHLTSEEVDRFRRMLKLTRPE